MNNTTFEATTIDLETLTKVTGGAGGENGGPASERPRKGLTKGQKIGVGIAAGVGILGGIASGGGPEDVLPRRPRLGPPPKPPTTITQPKFGLMPI